MKAAGETAAADADGEDAAVYAVYSEEAGSAAADADEGDAAAGKYCEKTLANGLYIFEINQPPGFTPGDLIIVYSFITSYALDTFPELCPLS